MIHYAIILKSIRASLIGLEAASSLLSPLGVGGRSNEPVRAILDSLLQGFHRERERSPAGSRLSGTHNASWPMGKPRSVFVFVAVLAPGSGCAAEILHDHVRFTERLRTGCTAFRIHHRDRHGRGMHATAPFGRRHALQPMAAALGVQGFNASPRERQHKA